MKYNRHSIKNRFLAFLFIMTIVLSPFESIKVLASEEKQNPQIAASSFSENFIPTKSFYPSYLSKYSDQKSNTIKTIWERLFYEQYKNPKWSNTVDKGGFYVDSTTDYQSLGDGPKSFVGIDFGKDDKDFDAYFGNTITENPEFLGELLGLPGYKAIEARVNPQETADIQNLMKNIVYTKMNQSFKYQYFAKAMAKLTEHGLYIGTNTLNQSNELIKGQDNLLKDVSYNGQTFDIWMLCSLASLYEGDGNETWLSEKQVAWLKTYQLILYNDYADNGAGSIAGRYPAIYDLVARSSYAANNYRSLGQEFFDYVVKSGTGAGAWLNLNDSINIPELNSYNNLVEIFKASQGFCCGLEPADTCTSTDNCKSHGTTIDRLALELFKNPSANNYIKNNPSTAKAMGISPYDNNGWWYRYKLKHTKSASLNSNSIIIPMNDILTNKSQGNVVAKSWNSGYHGQGTGIAVANSTTNITLYLKDILPSDEKPTGTTRPSKILIGLYVKGEFGITLTKDPANGGNVNSHSATRKKALSINCSPGINYNTKPIKYKSYYADGGVKPKPTHDKTVFFEFDVSKLHELEQLMDAHIQIKASAAASADSTNGEGFNTPDGATSYATANIGPLPTIMVYSPVDDCDINQHYYSGKIKWDDNHSSAIITYSCSKDSTKDRSHSFTFTPNDVFHTTTDGVTKYYTYGCYGEPYSETVNKKKKLEPTPIILDDTNSHKHYVADKSSNVIYPSGSGTTDIRYGYTNCNAIIHNGSLNKGYIPLGVKKIEVFYTATETLEELNILVKSGTGKTIGQAYVTNNMGHVMIELFDTSDEALANSYISFDGAAYTTHEKNDFWWNGPPETAYVRLSIDKILLYY